MSKKLPKTDVTKYDKISPREHVLLRPDTYIGDIEPTTEKMWILKDSKIVKEEITYTPGLLKIFDEILVNSADASQNDKTCDTIKVEYNKDEGYISVWNNGDNYRNSSDEENKIALFSNLSIQSEGHNI